MPFACRGGFFRAMDCVPAPQGAGHPGVPSGVRRNGIGVPSDVRQSGIGQKTGIFQLNRAPHDRAASEFHTFSDAFGLSRRFFPGDPEFDTSKT